MYGQYGKGTAFETSSNATSPSGCDKGKVFDDEKPGVVYLCKGYDKVCLGDSQKALRSASKTFSQNRLNQSAWADYSKNTGHELDSENG